MQPAAPAEGEESSLLSEESNLEESSGITSSLESSEEGESSLSENQILAPNLYEQDYEQISENSGGEYTVMLSGREFSDKVD